jgi:hypothetical protein
MERREETHHEAEQARYAAIAARLDPQSILAVVLDGLRDDETSEILDYIAVTLRTGGGSYMPEPTMRRICADLNHAVNRAIDEAVGQVSAVCHG